MNKDSSAALCFNAAENIPSAKIKISTAKIEIIYIYKCLHRICEDWRDGKKRFGTVL